MFKFNLTTLVRKGRKIKPKTKKKNNQKVFMSGNDLYETEMVRLITQMDVRN